MVFQRVQYGLYNEVNLITRTCICKQMKMYKETYINFTGNEEE